MSPPASFFAQSLHTIVNKGLLIGIGVLIGIVMARGLGPEGRGMVAVLMVLPALVEAFGELGVRQSTAYLIGKKTYRPADVQASMLALYCVTAVAGFLVVLAGEWLLGAFRYGWGLCLLFACLAPVTLLDRYASGLLLGRQMIGRMNHLVLLDRAVCLVMLVLLVGGLGAGTGGAAWALLAGPLAATSVLLYWIRRHASLRPRWVSPIPGELLRRGLVFGSALLVVTLNYRVGVLIVGNLCGSPAAGIYSVGVSVCELLRHVPLAVGVVLFSRSISWTGELAQRNLAKVCLLCRLMWPLVAGLACAVGLLAPWGIPWLYGEAFGPSVGVVWGLLPGTLVLTAFLLLHSHAAGQGAAHLALAGFLPGLALNVLLNLWLVPAYGHVGAAWASTASYAFSASVYLVGFARRFQVRLSDLVLPRRHDLAELAAQFRRSASAPAATSAPPPPAEKASWPAVQRRKVAFVVETRGHGRGGHAWSARTVAEALRAHMDCVLVNVGPNPSPVLQSAGLPYHYVPFHGFNLWSAARGVLAVVDRQQVDVLNVYNTGIYCLARLAALLRRKPLVFTKCGGPVPRWYFPRVEELIVFHAEDARHFATGGKTRAGRVHLIPNRVQKAASDPEKIAALRRRLDPRRTTFLRISRFVAKYLPSVEQGIALVDRLNQDGLPSQLVVVGAIEEIEAHQAVASRQNAHVILATENEFTLRASAVIDVADFVIGTGRGFMEAASRGRVLLTPHRGSRYPALVTEENFPRLFATNFSPRNHLADFDEEANYRAVKDAVRDARRQAMLQAQALRLFQEHFDVASAVPRYDDILGSARPSARLHLFDLLLSVGYALGSYGRYRSRAKQSLSNVTVHGLGTGSFFGPFRAEKCACPLPAHNETDSVETMASRRAA